MRRYPKRLYSAEQRAWCQSYERDTGFEPAMEEYDAGSTSFYEAAQRAVQWFEDWSTDAYLGISRNIPGWEEQYGGFAGTTRTGSDHG